MVWVRGGPLNKVERVALTSPTGRTPPGSCSPSAVEDERIAEKLMCFANARAPGKTFCPSEVARALAKDWRPLMPHIRRVAVSLPLIATHRGERVHPEAPGGHIRLQLDRSGASDSGSEE